MTLLDGYLFRPEGNGPFPAIVALHGCSGLFTKRGKLNARFLDWGRRLAGLGYVVLFPFDHPDLSFKSRKGRAFTVKKDGTAKIGTNHEARVAAIELVPRMLARYLKEKGE
jgi:dienelactone hydrolase